MTVQSRWVLCGPNSKNQVFWMMWLMLSVRLIVTRRVRHSEATVREMHEQMGCSLFKGGGLPKWTDWEVDEGREGKKQKKTKHWRSINSRLSPSHLGYCCYDYWALYSGTQAVYSHNGANLPSKFLIYEFRRAKAESSFLTRDQSCCLRGLNWNWQVLSAVVSKLIKPT